VFWRNADSTFKATVVKGPQEMQAGWNENSFIGWIQLKKTLKEVDLTTGKPRQPAELMEKRPWSCQAWNKTLALIRRST